MSSIDGGPLVFSHRRYLLWKAVDAWLLDSPQSRGAAGAWVARANSLPKPAPFPDDFPAVAALQAALVPLVGWEDLIGASPRDILRACPRMRPDEAQRVAARVLQLIEAESGP